MTDSMTSRREFLNFLGRGAAAWMLAPALFTETGCKKKTASSSGLHQKHSTLSRLPFTPLAPHFGDTLALASGLSYHVISRWGDTINQKGDVFGYNNDFTAFLPHPTSSLSNRDGLLWVNHESPHRFFVGKASSSTRITVEHIERERAAVGGSLVRIRRTSEQGEWSVDKRDARNRRFSAKTPILLHAPRPIAGKRVAQGTLANCCGGQTPWNTVLTCEENYDEFYGEAIVHKGKRHIDTRSSKHGWHTFFPEPPEHYGWVVEIHPETGFARKLTALGRFAHEGAAVTQAKDKRCVVYMGDDEYDQCIYKFIAKTPGTLTEGELFVAHIEKGEWLPLSIKKQAILQKHFKDQTDVLIHTRRAAQWLGGTPLARPEGVQVDPQTKAIYASLTKDPRKGNHFGSILKIEEEHADVLSMRFKASTFLAGGPTQGFACPDNLAFDPVGHLWMTNDISSSKLGKGIYKDLGHNSLHCIPVRGRWAGHVLRIASAPIDAELTGISFAPDGKTLFLSVQHPGGRSKDAGHLTSHWPDGGKQIPRPAVVAITGPTLEHIQKM